MKRNAFSLAELMVTIGIISLLVTIVSPTASRSMALARQAICKSNLHGLMASIAATRQAMREREERQVHETFFFKKFYWPQQPSYEGAASDKLLLCPEGKNTFSYGHPPLQFKSGAHGKLVPFDPEHYSCCMREGETAAGEKYTEYCIEEMNWLPSKWTHEPCCGEDFWSTNDGIWRVFRKAVDGKRRIVLTYYDCGWPNEIYMHGKFKWDNLTQYVGQDLYFDDVVTNYAYNALLGTTKMTAVDTVVLLDYNDVHADPDDPDLVDNLNSMLSARHLGQHNVLYANGSVESVGSVSLYPNINRAQWTPEDDTAEWAAGNK
jgi:prepilin-type N-terminal cleavage/methylation domain-containing protein